MAFSADILSWSDRLGGLETPMLGVEGQQKSARGPSKWLRDGQKWRQLTCCKCSSRRCGEAASSAYAVFKHTANTAEAMLAHDVIHQRWRLATTTGVERQDRGQPAVQQLQVPRWCVRVRKPPGT